MGWLQECATVLAENNLPIKWKTRTGFKALQAYKKFNDHRFNTVIGDIRIQARVHKETEQINKGRSILGVSPNVIHSFDATHLQMTVNALAKGGLQDFCMIHDSYGVHACDVDTLALTIRDEFFKLYSEDVLADLYEQFKAQAGDKEIPKPPARGDFDIELVKAASYFFA
jgi:DNA-directed RNA polymerase